MRYSPVSSKERITSSIFSATAKGVLSSAQPIKQSVLNIKNMSHVTCHILNKRGPRRERQSDPFDRSVSNAQNASLLSVASLKISGIINKRFCMPYPFRKRHWNFFPKYCKRILKVAFATFSQISKKILEVYSLVCHYFWKFLRLSRKQVWY